MIFLGCVIGWGVVMHGTWYGESTLGDRAPCDVNACSAATHMLKDDLTGLLCANATCIPRADESTCCEKREDTGSTEDSYIYAIVVAILIVTFLLITVALILRRRRCLRSSTDPPSHPPLQRAVSVVEIVFA